MDDYQSFLQSKLIRAQAAGFEVSEALNKHLFDWQELIARWSIRLGRCAIFAGCGCGKTIIQMVWAEQVARHTGGPVLILAPLAVSHQTVREGTKFGIPVNLCSSQSDVRDGINITNYQKFLKDRFNASKFAAVVADESSILKSLDGKTKTLLIDSFANTPYRLCCTATPAPNDYTELGNHAEFLGIMRSSEMLSRWFINDSSNTGDYRLKKHAEKDFWQWVASWAVSVDKPSDLGFSDEGFILPPLNVQDRIVKVDLSERSMEDEEGQKTFVPVLGLTATSLHQEMRLTAEYRARTVADLIAKEPDEVWLVWCHTNYEADALVAALPKYAVEVRGGESDDAKERKLLGFVNGDYKILISKPSLAGHGLNLQHCARVAFVGLSYSHELFYQAVRRCWRYGQKRPVDVYVVCADTEGPVLNSIKRKEADHIRMRQAMRAATTDVGILNTVERRIRNVVAHKVWKSNSGKATLHLGDSVDIVKTIPDDSIDFTIFSPPFSSLFVYSGALADMGNSGNDDEFLQHFGYMVPDLLRVLKPGRILAMHCKDLPLHKGKDGVAGLKDFSGDLIRLFTAAGWIYQSRVTIWKDPVTEMQRTKANHLLHCQLLRDSTASHPSTPDYLLLFRKINADLGKHPVKRKKAEFPVERWQEYASPVWMDIEQGDTLNVKIAREDKDERHICPLQLCFIKRCIELWTAPDELVFDPFNGIGSSGYVALQEGRRYLGCELKESYFNLSCKYLEMAEVSQKNLFEFPVVKEGEAV